MMEVIASISYDTVLALELAVTSALLGLIWIVQVVHYPLFAVVGREHARAYEAEHCRRIAFVVIPLMLSEVALVVLHLLLSSGSWVAIVGGLLVVTIWASTFFLQMPLHQQLASGFDADTVRRLVNTNWIRTVAWTLRAALLLTELLVRTAP